MKKFQQFQLDSQQLDEGLGTVAKVAIKSAVKFAKKGGLKKVGKNWIKFTKNSYLNSRSQDIPTIYHDIGSFYFYRTSSLLKKGNILPKKTTYFYINRHKTVDINYPIDLKIAKIKFKLLKKNG